MALVVKDRVKETTTSTGTGTVTLAGATQGYQSFSVVGDGNTTYYTIADGTDWEVGIGTYTASGTTLSRDTILESSNSGSAVNFSAGTKDVFVTYPAEKAVTLDGTETLTNKTINASNNTISNVDLTTDITGTLPIANGGTNATTAAGALASLGAYADTNPAGYTTNTGTVTSVAATAGTGISVSGSPITTSGTLTITNTAPDQTVTLTQAGTTTITGTYPNFTISSADQYDGTVTSVGGTGTVNGLTLSGTVTSSGNLTLGGALAISNADWSGTDLSVANGGTGVSSLTSGYVLKGNGTSPVSASVIYDDGTNAGIGTSSPGAKLHVAGTSNFGGAINLLSGSQAYFYNPAGNAFSYISMDASNNVQVFNNAGAAIAFSTSGTERLRITSAGRLGLNTTAPTGLLSVASTSSSGTTIGSWTSAHSVFGPNVGSTTGAALGLGYNTTTDTAEIVSIAPSVAWKNMRLIAATMDLETISGRVQTNQSFRAPIFYDSDNTGYYVDPNGTSLLNTVGVDSLLNLSSGAPLFISSASAAYQRVDGRNDGVDARAHWYGVTTSGATSNFRHAWYDGAAYFNVTASGGQIYFERSGGATVNASGDFRAQAFYDSNDTTYYLDPAGGSNLYTTKFNTATNGAAGRTIAIKDATTSEILFGSYPGGWTSALQIQNNDNSDFFWISPLDVNNNARIRTGGCGLDFYTDGGNDTGTYSLFVGSGYATGQSSLRAPIFYDSDNTAFYFDGASTTNINALSGNGKDIFTTTDSYLRINQSNSFTSGIWFGSSNLAQASGAYAAFGSNGGTTNSRVYIYGGTYTGANAIAIDGANSRITAQGDIRAPIFYDSNNTNFYVNPDGTSILSSLDLNDRLRTETPTAYTAVTSLTADTAPIRVPEVNIGTTASFLPALGQSSIYTSGYRQHFVLGNYRTASAWNGGMFVALGGNDSYATEYFLLNYGGSISHSSGSVTINGSARAPIFYDSNDTAYFADPNGRSRLSSMDYGDGGYYFAGGDWGYRHNTPYGWIQFGPANTSHAHIYTDRTNFYFNAQLIVNGGSNINTSDIRANIFYDNQNTAYYVDPASGSYVYGEFTVQQAGVNGLRIASGTGTQSLWVRAGYDTNGTATPVVSGTNVMFQSSGSSGGSFTFVSGNTKALTITGDYAQGGGSLRAPIFYDSDNTAYYVDPNGGSRMNSIQADEVYAFGWLRNNNSGNGVYNQATGQHFYSDSGNGWNIAGGGGNNWLRFRDTYGGTVRGYVYADNGNSIGFLNSSGSWRARVVSDDYFLVEGSSARAPIFYDSNNTGYYVDPNSTSNLNRLLLQPRNDNYFVGSMNPINAVADLQSLTNVYGQFTVTQYNEINNYANAPGGVYQYGAVMSWRTENHSFQLYASHTGDLSYKTQWQNDNYSGWLTPVVYGRNAGSSSGKTIYGTILYDADDTSYYCDPNARSRFVAIDTTGGTYNVFRTWTDLTGFHGLYSSVHNGAHFYPNNGSYGSWKIDGSRNSWAGIEFGSPSNGAVSLMIGTDSNTSGFHNNTYGWQFRWAGGTLFCHKGTYGGGTAATVWDSAQGSYTASSDFRAPIFYDSNNTAYYTDPASTSILNVMQAVNTQHSAADGNGVRFWASDSYKIYMSSSGNGTWGGRVAGETTSDYNMYFRMAAGTNRGFVFSAGSAGTTKVAGIDASGNGRFIGDVVAYSSSDARLKENLEVIPNALDKVQALSGYTFDWNDKQDAYEVGKRDVGVIAQDVEAVLPEVVVDRELTGYKAVNYEKLVPLLIEAIKELKAEVETLKKG